MSNNRVNMYKYNNNKSKYTNKNNIHINKNNKFALLDSDSDSDNDQKTNENCDTNINSNIPISSIDNIINTIQINNNPNDNNNPDTNNSKFKYVSNNKSNKTVSSNSNQPSNNIINQIENETFKHYYGKKTVNKSKTFNNNINNYNNYNKYNKYNHVDSNITFNSDTNNTDINDDNGFITVGSKKNDKFTMECVYKKIEPNIFDLNLNNYFRVLVHHNNDKSWDFNSYHNIATLKKWRDLGTFFKTLNIVSGECVYTDFAIFIMKNEISPMWEDSDNRNGSICSIKIDSVDIGYELFKKLSIHMANNTLLKFNPNNWDSINGISYSYHNIAETNCVILKIWFKINILNLGSVEKILNDDVNLLISKYSIKLRPIKPEY